MVVVVVVVGVVMVVVVVTSSFIVECVSPSNCINTIVVIGPCSIFKLAFASALTRSTIPSSVAVVTDVDVDFDDVGWC